MVAVVITSPFDREFFGSRDRFQIDAPNLFALVDALDREGPGFAEVAQVRAQLAIDGTIEPDWSSPLAGAGEVIVLARIGGG